MRSQSGERTGLFPPDQLALLSMLLPLPILSQNNRKLLGERVGRAPDYLARHVVVVRTMAEIFVAIHKMLQRRNVPIAGAAAHSRCSRYRGFNASSK